MRKLSTLTLALFLTLPWLAGCNSGDQGPSSEQTKTPAGGGIGSTYRPNGNDFSNPRPINSDAFSGSRGNGDAPPVRTAALSSDIDWDHPPQDMILVTVHFGFDQFNIEREDRALVEAAAKVLAGDPSMRVVAVGHTDHFGSEQYNLALSDRRANTVKAYLTNNGASATQTEVLARGKFGAAPDAKKDSPEARNDRRVDVIKIPAGATIPTTPPPSATATVTPTTAP